jgi:hypothetical protein
MQSNGAVVEREYSHLRPFEIIGELPGDTLTDRPLQRPANRRRAARHLSGDGFATINDKDLARHIG